MRHRLDRVLICWSTMPLALGFALALAACGPLPIIGPTPMPTPSAVLRVAIRERIIEGMLPASPVVPLTPEPTPIPQRFQGPVLVQVVVAGQPRHVIAEQTTEGGRDAEFHLTPGRYWALIPATNQPVLTRLTSPRQLLPDKTSVYAWKEVATPATGGVETTLVYDYVRA